MALFPKTPGVYIEEIPRFPSSVAAVPTSVPVFIGYTKQAVIDGVTVTSFPTNPVRIESLLQFETIFGGAKAETFSATLSGPSVDIASAKTTAAPPRRLYYNLQMYFANGGGPCYIVSTGTYSAPLSATDFTNGINKAEQVDEITMVVAPEAILLDITPNNDRGAVYNAMLAHCAKMQDRFSLLDVEVFEGNTPSTNTIANDAERFRDDTIGANNLSYGAAYYPSFDSSLRYNYADTDVTITANAVNLPLSVQTYHNKSLEVVNNGVKSYTDLTGITSITPNAFLIGGIQLGTSGTSTPFTGASLAAAINANPALSVFFVATETGSAATRITQVTAGVPTTTVSVSGSGATITPGPTGIAPDKTLYNRIKSSVDAIPLLLYPSATMAGIYCAVDSSRGVWKAPANVGVTLIDSLGRTIKDSDQSDLNVDATSGKSIDVIRNFPGRGNLVWGARTLDGNSNEWRYVNVRRTFLFIEDSCKKATEFVVFEPNDMNTWLRIKGMISSFLNTLWRDGALAGSKPEQAFFVKVGLGETMTSQDILEGRLIVQIGLAVVRPAEFIILQFEHKLQVS